ncbi:MAG: calcium/sodium antiporter [Pseudomonadota bacterium]
MIANILLIVAGFGLLVFGGELLVRGAVSLAERLKVSAFVIGAVVIGFGSSTPELVTSIEAALIGAPGIAIGNIVGSNIINILVVLGIAGVIAPIALSGDHVRIDTIIVCALTAAFVGLCTAFQLTPLIGAVLLIALAVYLTYSVRREMYSTGQGGVVEAEALDVSMPSQSLPFALGALVIGFGLLVLGGHFVVSSAVVLAKAIGVSETIIGLTVVAFGTSLPEIVTAVIAAVRRHADVALGNVLGSCVFNLLAIAGVLSLISPINVPQAILQFDNLIMLAAASLLLLAVVAFRQIGRPLGVIFLGGYAAYLAAIWP